MRDSVGGGHRPPPNARSNCGVGLRSASGDQVVVSGGMEEKFKNSNNVFTAGSSSACKGNMQVIDSGETHACAVSCKRDPLADGHRQTPNLLPGGCASMDRICGISGPSSEGLGRDFLIPGEPCFSVSTSIPPDNNLVDGSKDHMDQDEIILDAGCVSDDKLDVRSSILVKPDGISSSEQVGGILPLPQREEACMHFFFATRPTCKESNLHDISSAGHSFSMDSSAYSRQKFLSSKTSRVCTSGDCHFVQEKREVQNSNPLGSMNFLHVNGLKLKDFGNGGDAKPPSSSNVRQSVNAWSRPPVVSLPKINDSENFLIDENSVRLDEEALHANYKQFEGALIGRLFGKPLAFFHLNAELKRRWEQFGSFRLVMSNASRFICFFDCVEARDNVMMGGPWVIAGQVLSINNWSASFISSPKDELITPIWVRLPGLPLHCWDSQNLTRITTPIGEPLWIDSATALMERGAFARVCVKMDLSKPVKAGIWVYISQGKFFQPVEYEGLPVLCFGCGLVGHKVAGCKIKNKESWTSKVKPNNIQVNGSVAVLNESTDGTTNEQGRAASSKPSDVNLQPTFDDPGLGPWTVVSRRKHPPQQAQGSKFRPSCKGQMPFTTINRESVDKRRYNSSSCPSIGAAGGHSNTNSSTRLGHLQNAADGNKLKIINDMSLPSSNSQKFLAGKVFDNKQQNDFGWAGNQHDMKILNMQDIANPVVIHTVVGQPEFGGFSAISEPNATILGDSQHSEVRVGVEHNSSAHGLNENLTSHGAIVPYNCQAANENMIWEGGKRKGVNSLKIEKMLNDLGPVSLSPRKRRMITVEPVGEDASPIPTS